MEKDSLFTDLVPREPDPTEPTITMEEEASSVRYPLSTSSPDKVGIPTSIIVTVSPKTARSNTITWKNLVGSAKLYRSLTLADHEWKEIYLIKEDTPPIYIDHGANNTYFYQARSYYKIVPDDTTFCLPSIPTTNLGKLDPYGAEIARRHEILLRQGLSGNPVYCFIRKRGGTRCPKCWDSILAQRSKHDCPVCLATGYLHGYYDPIPAYMSVSPEEFTANQGVEGPAIDGTLNVWIGAYPFLNNGDVIVEPPTGNIWFIKHVGLTTHKRVPVKQNLVLSKEEGDSTIYALLQRVPEIQDHRYLPQEKESLHACIVGIEEPVEPPVDPIPPEEVVANG